MKYKIQNTDGFNITMTETKVQEGIIVLHFAADNTDKEAKKLNFTVRWQIPDIGVHATWGPG